MHSSFDSSELDVISSQDQEQLAQICRLGTLFPQTIASLSLAGVNEKLVALPDPLYRVPKDAIAILVRGDALIVGSVHQQLTTTAAANLLGISRQYLVRLLERGDLPYQMIGSHRRLRLGDVLMYSAQRNDQRRNALDEVTQIDEELGAYD